MTQQNSEGSHQHSIASPNPTIDDSKSSAAGADGKVEATKVRAAASATHAPMKTTAKPTSKSKTRRNRPRED